MRPCGHGITGRDRGDRHWEPGTGQRRCGLRAEQIPSARRCIGLLGVTEPFGGAERASGLSRVLLHLAERGDRLDQRVSGIDIDAGATVFLAP